MANRDVRVSNLLETIPGTARQSNQWRRFRPRRPASARGWLVWLLVALILYLMISYILLPLWYRPGPTDIPPSLPDNTTRRIG